ncbi:hypothetical protein [Streptomyces erythrochromogenes]|uniref:hypothetical protein n=1 Tax=Streptomyces erythrochromogenes TaxID=285574 RepID=UPI00368F5F0A
MTAAVEAHCLGRRFRRGRRALKGCSFRLPTGPAAHTVDLGAAAGVPARLAGAEEAAA